MLTPTPDDDLGTGGGIGLRIGVSECARVGLSVLDVVNVLQGESGRSCTIRFVSSWEGAFSNC